MVRRSFAPRHVLVRVEGYRLRPLGGWPAHHHRPTVRLGEACGLPIVDAQDRAAQPALFVEQADLERRVLHAKVGKDSCTVTPDTLTLRIAPTAGSKTRGGWMIMAATVTRRQRGDLRVRPGSICQVSPPSAVATHLRRW
jgi:hypothetical protein